MMSDLTKTDMAWLRWYARYHDQAKRVLAHVEAADAAMAAVIEQQREADGDCTCEQCDLIRAMKAVRLPEEPSDD